MRNCFFLGVLFLLISCGNNDRLFPRKHLGTYHGVQESYDLKVDGDLLTVQKAKYSLVLDYGRLWITTPVQKKTGTYEVIVDTKMYYALKVRLDSGVEEEWQLWKKGKKLVRRAIAPQPEIIFVKDC